MPKYSTTCIKDEVAIRLTDTNQTFESTTFVHAFQRTVARLGDHPALFYQSTTTSDWQSYTWTEYYNESVRFAKALLHLGFRQFDTVGLSGFNAAPWFFAYVGGLLAGGVAAGIYTTNGAEACFHVCDHAATSVVVVDGLGQLAKFLSIAPRLQALRAIVVYNVAADDLLNAATSDTPVPVYTFDVFLALGNDTSTATLDARMAAVRPGHCMSLIYTSGTTGQPKGVMVSHDAFCYTAAAMGATLPHLRDDDRAVSFLPLSHIAGQIIDFGIHVHFGWRVYLAQPDALQGSLVATLKAARPTFFLAVPRVFEKMMERMLAVGRAASTLKRTVGAWAKAIGTARVFDSQFGHDNTTPWFHSVADALVFQPVQAALGLDAAKVIYSGAAPLAPDVLAYFAAFDMPILEALGLSEASGAGFAATPATFKRGTLGRVLPGMDTRVDAETSELLLRGRAVMMGYLNDEALTAAALDADGWLHTGDCASIDADGFATITGRRKELLITAGGENVPPLVLEHAIKEELPLLSHVMVVGDRRKFLSAVVALPTVDDDIGQPSDTLTAATQTALADTLGCHVTTTADAAACDAFRAHVAQGLARANDRATSRAQRVHKFIVAASDFGVSGGELTATMKLRRHVVLQKYADAIDALYATET
ncbi:Aste57867_13943 [Aphanomyces stellatus]|uniref:Aste57867_13943 protein n=1 Tax=Aphanomyces stellatus TaxID=120398 RepID=A0A485L1M3_9STRA|nr:hypothetical protein As57867_013892 [Aphanomyces stellatus]VFT90773.1 Aste57867_13943 [Aphanomyces stellatus]